MRPEFLIELSDRWKGGMAIAASLFTLTLPPKLSSCEFVPGGLDAVMGRWGGERRCGDDGRKGMVLC
jgi:hypothetical protein